MTRFQRFLSLLGCTRFQWFRRWVGGRWVEHYLEPTPHSSECPRWRWELDPGARFDDTTHTIEQWETKLPAAQARTCK